MSAATSCSDVVGGGEAEVPRLGLAEGDRDVGGHGRGVRSAGVGVDAGGNVDGEDAEVRASGLLRRATAAKIERRGSAKGRARPVPSTASTTRLADRSDCSQSGCRRRRRSASTACAPAPTARVEVRVGCAEACRGRARHVRAPGLEVACGDDDRRRRCCRRRRGPGRRRRRAWRATPRRLRARPARSMRVSVETPAASAPCSRRRICCVLRARIIGGDHHCDCVVSGVGDGYRHNAEAHGLGPGLGAAVEDEARRAARAVGRPRSRARRRRSVRCRGPSSRPPWQRSGLRAGDDAHERRPTRPACRCDSGTGRPNAALRCRFGRSR